MTTTTTLTVRSFGLLDDAVRPMLDELAHEYLTRYGDDFTADDLRQELERYPAPQFAAPDGDLILLLDDGVAVAGGAFRLRAEPELGDAALLTRPGTRDADGLPTVRTAEYKRIWTSSAHRRRGLARRVLVELEARAVAAGYQRLYLTTGPRQPEAAALYLATGFTPLFDVAADPVGPLAFEKWLCTDAPPSRPSPTPSE
ncbi:GNAT family N-acetyltransferase [Cellulomonas sp. ICMP 17802]|uniref:GNAT family N-acetyltransferase n=1 Tax=Cellulomonas sp. ICMP 17802 TaxID=3239199 RepID=UPI00351B3F88